jgi:hypothetical protein
MEMIHFLKGYFGFFDAGTSDRGSLSLWFRCMIPGFEDMEPRVRWEGAPETMSPRGLLPKHRTWSGGLLFTLPDTYL